MEDLVITEEFKQAFDLLEYGNDHVFLTGNAGTGKSTFLRYWCERTMKKYVLLAPTGIAAVNIGGQTIHRFFGFPRIITYDDAVHRKPKTSLKELDTLVIDEISMVRPDLLECVEIVCRKHGPEKDGLFGGVQVVFVGDLCQLPPVVTKQELPTFSRKYRTKFFYSANCFDKMSECFDIINLLQVFRQKDPEFLDLLNSFRRDKVDVTQIKAINSRLVSKPTIEDGRILLSTTNKIADGVNRERLDALDGEMMASQAFISGEFGKEYWPTDEVLVFKEGAQIMMLNNDKELRWQNGTIGVLEEIIDEEQVRMKLFKPDGREYEAFVEQHEWKIYGIRNKGEKAKELGSFRQLPFKLAWAVTIHKSQGKTFEKVTIDLGRGAWDHGQVYTALSRVTSFQGLELVKPVRKQDVKIDPSVVAFINKRRLT